MKVLFSARNDPCRWETDEFDVIQFATAEDAKKAEALFNKLSAARPEATRFIAAGYVDATDGVECSVSWEPGRQPALGQLVYLSHLPRPQNYPSATRPDGIVESVPIDKRGTFDGVNGSSSNAADGSPK